MFEAFIADALPWAIAAGLLVLLGFGFYGLRWTEPEDNYQSPTIRDNVRRVK